jgi:hypothetical protein
MVLRGMEVCGAWVWCTRFVSAQNRQVGVVEALSREGRPSTATCLEAQMTAASQTR